PNFFVPTERMLDFREEASKAKATSQIEQLKDLPCLNLWFLDWVRPRKKVGKRYRFPFETNLPPRQSETQNGVVRPPDTSGRGRKTTARRGRPKGETPDVSRRKKEMIQAWDRGEYETKAEAGRAHGFQRSDAAKIIKAHERKKCRK